eukprot:9404607-Alexandrium_andersonii.AAC.1
MSALGRQARPRFCIAYPHARSRLGLVRTGRDHNCSQFRSAALRRTVLRVRIRVAILVGCRGRERVGCVAQAG